MTHTLAPAAQVFHTEIDQARRLGYTVQARVTDMAVIVRLVPRTQRTKRIAQQNNSTAIEAVVAFDTPSHRLDAMYDALQAVLRMAHDAAA